MSLSMVFSWLLVLGLGFAAGHSIFEFCLPVIPASFDNLLHCRKIPYDAWIECILHQVLSIGVAGG
jgi:hypothetical protein